MVTKEHGKFFGVCDLCDDGTPLFDTWGECLTYMKDNNWKNTKNKQTDEWENYCPVCQRKLRQMKTSQDFDSLDG